MPEGNVRAKLLRKVLFAITLGGALAFASWIVAYPPMCLPLSPNPRSPCESVLRNRGFPIPWIGEYGIPFGPPSVTLSGPLSWQIDFTGLGVDLAVWIWISLVGILLVSKAQSESPEAIISRRTRLTAIIASLLVIATGLIADLLGVGLTLVQGDFEAQYSLSLLAFALVVLGVGNIVAVHHKSQVSKSLTCLVGGALITFATSLAPRLFDVFPFDYFLNEISEYGLPLGWFTISMYGYYSVVTWAFLLDMLIWSSIIAALVVLIPIYSSKRLTPGLNLRSNVPLAIVLGTVVTVSSWLVWSGLQCNDTLSCAFPTLARGFPLPWIRQFALPNIEPYQGGVETQVEYANLAFDFCVWAWLSFVGLLAAGERRSKTLRNLIRRRSWIAGMSLAITAVVAGLFMAVIVSPELKTDFLPVGFYNLSFLGYSIMILGAAALTASYRKGELSIWLICLTIGALITIATFWIPQSVGPDIFLMGQYGVPFAWLNGAVNVDSFPLYYVGYLAFVTDVLIWSCSIAALLLFRPDWQRVLRN